MVILQLPLVEQQPLSFHGQMGTLLYSFMAYVDQICFFDEFLTSGTLRLPLVEQERLARPKNISSPQPFIEVLVA